MCKCGGADEHLHQVGEAKNLVQFIDIPKCSALNVTKTTMTNLNSILQKEPQQSCYLESDADDQILLKIAMGGSCKIKAIAVQSNATRLRCYVNNESFDFSSSGLNPQQEWMLLSMDSEMIEYPTKVFKFSNVSHLSLLFEGDCKSRICGIKLLGDALDLKRGPVITDYELRPNVSDHKTGGLFNVQSHNRF